MPVHDWSRVDAGIFHAFHHGWIEEIARALNRERLPDDYYALPEQNVAGFGPDVLTLQELQESSHADARELNVQARTGGTGLLLVAPKLQPVGETEMEYYRRKSKVIAVRHVSGDRLVAVIELVSPGNKSARNAIRAFVEKAAEFLDRDIHLLIVDLHPPGKRDPDGIHGEIWQEIAGQEYTLPADKPLTLAAYETGGAVRAYVVHVAIGDSLADMPLFLEPRKAVEVPLEATYQAAYVEVPRRWRQVLG